MTANTDRLPLLLLLLLLLLVVLTAVEYAMT
jgi:hypothetical protein